MASVDEIIFLCLAEDGVEGGKVRVEAEITSE